MGFFAHTIINTNQLNPTASREGFVADHQLSETRDDLGDCLKSYLQRLAKGDPDRMHIFINIHHLAIKSLAVQDDECLEMFMDWLPFETSLGHMTFGEFRSRNPEIRYVSAVDRYRNLQQVATAESIPVINAGYIYETELLRRAGMLFSDLDIQPFEMDEIADRFQPLDLEERNECLPFLRIADSVLQPFHCVAELSRFQPTAIPALFLTNHNADFSRQVEQAQDSADDLWRGVMDGFHAEASRTSMAVLHLNYNNALIEKILTLKDPQAVARFVEIVYAQSLMAGQVPMTDRERRILGTGLLGVIDWALDQGKSNV